MNARLAAFLVAAALAAGCSAPLSTYDAARRSEFTQANYDAIDALMASVGDTGGGTVLVATVVNIDALGQSSRFGRLVGEQIATRLAREGYDVAEIKLRQSVGVREGVGEMMLSRDVRELTKKHDARLVIVGSYAVAATHVYLTLKAVSAADGRVLSAWNYTLPITDNTRALLAAQRPAAS